MVAEAGGLQDGVAVADAAQRAEGEEALILQPDLAPPHFYQPPHPRPLSPGGERGDLVDVLAADGAGGAGTAGHAAGGVQLLSGQGGGILEGPLLEVACRQGG